jgi:hypothetical protein
MELRPELKFQVDTEYDQWTCREFLSFKEDDIFSNSILRDHPDLMKAKELDKEAKKSFINEYVAGYYTNYIDELNKAAEKAKNDWSKIENQFFEISNKVFGFNNENGAHMYPWPDGNYICYVSIFNCNPRFIKEKEFQAYYKHIATTNYVCAHEMLHFIFYDYVERNFNDEFKSLGENAIWKLSEIFNDVVLRLPEFIVLTGQKDPSIYAQTAKELEQNLNLWQKSNNVNSFIRSYLKHRM